MAPQMSAADNTLITELPATLAGLWTAITTMHDTVMTVADDVDGSAGALADVVAHCVQAADTLAASRPQGIVGLDDRPANQEPADEGSDLRELTENCMDLAVEVLGNEDEPLTPQEVVAITRAVTSLCAARAALPEVGA